MIIQTSGDVSSVTKTFPQHLYTRVGDLLVHLVVILEAVPTHLTNYVMHNVSVS